MSFNCKISFNYVFYFCVNLVCFVCRWYKWFFCNILLKHFPPFYKQKYFVSHSIKIIPSQFFFRTHTFIGKSVLRCIYTFKLSIFMRVIFVQVISKLLTNIPMKYSFVSFSNHQYRHLQNCVCVYKHDMSCWLMFVV